MRRQSATTGSASGTGTSCSPGSPAGLALPTAGSSSSTRETWFSFLFNALILSPHGSVVTLPAVTTLPYRLLRPLPQAQARLLRRMKTEFACLALVPWQIVSSPPHSKSDMSQGPRLRKVGDVSQMPLPGHCPSHQEVIYSSSTEKRLFYAMPESGCVDPCSPNRESVFEGDRFSDPCSQLKQILLQISWRQQKWG
ncbi:hypothetical protein NL676_032254 [Syzygium grande]|nr:hypothetical protein NL676_032254 [Syzygium grande]